MYIQQRNPVGVQCVDGQTAEEGMISYVVKHSTHTGTRKTNDYIWLADAFMMMDTIRRVSPQSTRIKKKRRKRKIKGTRRENPDVNSKVCPAPVCGHWSFVYLRLLKTLRPAAAAGGAAQQSQRILGSVSIKLSSIVPSGLQFPLCRNRC